MPPLSFAAIALGALAALASFASADPKADATALNTEGHKLFGAKDYAGAADRFQRAYAIYPSAGLLLNLGTALQQEGHIVEAANVYQRYLDDPGAQEPYATQTRHSLAIVDSIAGRLALATADDVTEIQIGDASWEPAARVRVVRVAPGTFVVRARTANAHTAEATGRVGAGEQRTVELRPVALAAPAPSTAPVVAPTPEPATSDEADDTASTVDDTPRAHRTVALVVGGGGLALAAASVALAVHASSRYADASAACHGDPQCAGGDVDRARALASSAHTDRLVAVGLGVGAAAALATGAYLWFHTPRAHGAADHLALIFTPAVAGVAFAGRF